MSLNPIKRAALTVLFAVYATGFGWAQMPARVPENRPMLTILNDPINKSFQHDATLRSITCVSADRVVAVGDRGTVLVSSDAGRTWKLAPTPVSVNLYDVKFMGEVGYAVGGWISSETGISYGTIIRSSNAGETWEMVPAESLPRLIGIQWLGNRLICWGDHSVQLRSCVFASDDAGLTWQSAVSGLANATAAASNAKGQLAAIDQLGLAKIAPHSSLQTLGHAHWNFNVLVATSDRWFAAGENGELISSADGLRWENVRLPLRPETQRLCSWNCIEQHGSTLWLAGAPGSFVLRSTNGGQTWEVLRTGQNLPINKLSFIDPNRGWAVGPLGTILATRDGGVTWYPQRKQADRLCLLSVATNTECVPWLAAVATVWDQKRTAAAVVLKHTEPIGRANAKPSHESALKVAAGQMGLAELQICDISADNEPTALMRLAMQLVTWRPDVVLYASNLSTMLNEQTPERSLSKAIQLASSPEFRELLRPVMLESWSVPKLSSTTANGHGQYSEDAQRVLRDSGLSLRDVIGSLPKSDREASSELSMVTTWCRSESRAAQAELLGGVALQPNTQLTSKLPSLGNFQLVMGRVHRDRALQQLIAAPSQSADTQQWLTQLRFLLPSVPARELPELFVKLSDGLLAKQQWRHTELVLQQLISSDHGDTGFWASSLYFQLLSSKELRYWIDSTSSPELSSPTAAVLTANYQDTWSNSPFSSPETSARAGVMSASANNSDADLIVSATQQVRSTEGSNQLISQSPLSVSNADWSRLAEMAFNVHPRLRSEPQMLMLMAKHFRDAENIAGQRTLLNELSQQSQLIGWSQVAKQELAILDNRESQLKWAIVASPANSSPSLDGVFDEPFWLNAARMQLTPLSLPDPLPAEVAWAYDLEYLYLAIRCPQDRGQLVKPLAKQRSYDSDLKSLDHVELMIDVDRDYSTTIELAVAENGLTYDRCLNLSAFNPKWYVGMSQQPDAWQAEVAIKLDTLAEEIPQRGSRWAISARRLRPARSPQSWSQLKTHQRLPESAGLLLFE